MSKKLRLILVVAGLVAIPLSSARADSPRPTGVPKTAVIELTTVSGASSMTAVSAVALGDDHHWSEIRAELPGGGLTRISLKPRRQERTAMKLDFELELKRDALRVTVKTSTAVAKGRRAALARVPLGDGTSLECTVKLE